MEFKDIVKAFEARKDLAKFGQNALMLWALQIHYDIDDIESFASQSLTDGSDDKKVTLFG